MHQRFSVRKKSGFSVFYMILCINVFSIMVLSLFNYVVFHSNSKKTYLESFVAYNEKVTDLAFHNMDQQIMQPIYNIPQLYFSETKQNEPVLKPQEEALAERPSDISALVNGLKAIGKSYPSIKSMDVYYENTGIVVTGFDKVHFPRDEEELMGYLPWYQEFERQEMDRYFMEESVNDYPLKAPVLTYIRKIAQPRWKGKNIVVAIHISSDIFSEYIDENEGILEVQSGDGRLLYASPREERKSRQGVTAFQYTSSTTGLQYRYTMDNTIFYADVNSKNRVFLFNFLISIAFNVVLLLIISYYSNYIYREKLLRISREAGVPIQKDKKSFDSSLTQLQEEIITLHDTVNSSKSLLFQSAVRALLLNRKPDEAYQTLKPYLEYGRCRVLVIYRADAAENSPVEQLQEWFDGKAEKSHVLFATMEKGEIVAVLNYPKEEEETVFSGFAAAVEEFLGKCQITAGCVCPMEKDGVKVAYRSACEIYRYRFIFPEQKLLISDEIRPEGRKENGSHLKLFEAVEKDINSENLLEFKLHLEMLVTSFKSGNYTIDYCYSTLRDLVTLVYQIMQHRGLDMWVMYGYDIREYYKRIGDIDAFRLWMEETCEILLKNIRQKRKTVDGDLKGRLTSLIEENLENDITLDFLCDRLSMRSDVLSRTFKQVMGEGYTEYVKKRKLSRAIELMDGDCSMKEIAQRLGYNSPQYFIRIFKEVYGTTPYQYKKAKSGGTMPPGGEHGV